MRQCTALRHCHIPQFGETAVRILFLFTDTCGVTMMVAGLLFVILENHIPYFDFDETLTVEQFL